MPLGDAPRLVANYGGQPGDWVKMSSTQTKVISGASVQVHWFRNIQTARNVEFKFKRTYPKIAPKNQYFQQSMKIRCIANTGAALPESYFLPHLCYQKETDFQVTVAKEYVEKGGIKPRFCITTSRKIH